MKILISVLSIILFISCSGVSKKECTKTDWLSRGEALGRTGFGPKRLEQEKLACKEKHNVNIDMDTFKLGWFRGVKHYCNFDNGYNFGDRGLKNPNICPKRFNKEFNKGYRFGKKSYGRRKSSKSMVLKVGHKMTERSCQIDSDCNIQNKCSGTKCEMTGKSCLFSNDCVVEGSCQHNRCQYY